MDTAIATQIAIAAIALYAAILSTAVFVQQRRDRKIRIGVTVETGTAKPMPGDSGAIQLFTNRWNDDKPRERLLFVVGANTGQREATLGSLSFLLRDGQTHFLEKPIAGPGFPY